MQKIRYRVLLDVTRSGCQQVVDGVYRTENNVREFEIILIKGSQTVQLDNIVSVIIYGKKSDGTTFMQSCSVTDGNIIFCPKSDILSVNGDVECQVQVISDNDEIMFSPSFIISISDTVRDEDAIESSNEFTVLDEALLKVSSMDSGVPVYDTYSDLPSEAADDSLAFIKSASDTDFEPLYLAAADLSADSTKLPYEKIRVSKNGPEYDEETFRSYIELIVENGLDYRLSAEVDDDKTDSNISVWVMLCYSSWEKYPDYEFEDILPTTESECDYAIVVNPTHFIYLDSEGNEIDSDDFDNLHAIVRQYFYFLGNAHLYLDSDDGNVIDMDIEKGWYAFKLVDSNGDKLFEEIVLERVDNAYPVSIETSEYGYGKCSSEWSKKLLDGIFETPQKSGFYLKDGKWKNVVEGKRV